MLVPDFYQILKIDSSDQKIVAQISLNKDHKIYQGHFPGQPVVPGVMQLQMIKELVEKSLKCELFLSDVISAKYLNMINPNRTEEIIAEIRVNEKEKNVFKIDATITDNDLVYLKLKGTLSLTVGKELTNKQ